MPYKRLTKKKVTTKKKFRKAKLTKNVKFRNIVSAGSGFPNKMLMTHRYCQTFQHYSTSGVQSFYKFACNGMFDPDLTVGGGTNNSHQPYYFDQMAGLYNHYHVIGSKITIKIVPDSITNAPFAVTLAVNDDTTVSNGELSTQKESGKGKMVIFGGYANDSIRSISTKWSAKKMFGAGIMANNDLTGTVSSNPTELSVYTIGVQGLNAVASPTVGGWFEVFIEYIAIWDELKDVAQSA